MIVSPHRLAAVCVGFKQSSKPLTHYFKLLAQANLDQLS
eukprot:COSAG06_NODE_27247_length_597_cov_0.656627_1_plen_38_part_01